MGNFLFRDANMSFNEIKKYIEILFDPDDMTCMSEDFYGVDCNPLHIFNPQVHRFIVINSCHQKRNSKNIKKFRNFLIEIDDKDITIDDQMNFIRSIGLPFSSATYSGNKSIHFIISLDYPLEDEKKYKDLALELALAIKHEKLDKGVIQKASTFTRAPFAIRDNGNEQRLLFLGERIKNEILYKWIDSRIESNEKKILKSVTAKKTLKVSATRRNDTSPSLFSMRNKELSWLFRNEIREGDRNNKWFRIGCQMYSIGFELDDAIHELEQYFHEEHDFSYKEWEAAISNGHYYSSRSQGDF